MIRFTFPQQPKGVKTEKGVVPSEKEKEKYMKILLELKKKYPGIESELDKSSLALDGQIYQDPFLEEFGAASEIFFIPRIEGG